MKDSDICLKESGSDKGASCDDVLDLLGGCNRIGYIMDTHRCCPESCNISEPFTEEVCLATVRDPSYCVYPFPTLEGECCKSKNT